MKEKELRNRSTCGNCDKKIGASKVPFFYVVNIKRYGLNVPALQRQTELEMQLNNHVVLAQAMSPDEDLAEVMHNKTLTICENCSVENICIAELAIPDESLEDIK